ncbi:MAG: putative toxin-antitoxin system toxin component, PIN family [Pseudomonadota bacterium]
MKPRIVLDTCVMVAGLRSRQGLSHQILRHLPAGRFELLLSVPLLLEYEAVLKREAQQLCHGLSLADIDTLLGTWAAVASPVELHYLWRPQLTDPQDEMVLETAVNGRADRLITFNVKDFSTAARRFGLPVCSPADWPRQEWQT